MGNAKCEMKKVLFVLPLHFDGVRMKVKEIIRLIEKRGWYLVSQKGSHRQYKHSTIPGRVTIAGNLNDDLPKGTANSVFKQAGIK